MKQLYQEILHQLPPIDFFLQGKIAVLNLYLIPLFSNYRFYLLSLQFRRQDHNVCLKIENIHKLADNSWIRDRSHSRNDYSIQ